MIRKFRCEGRKHEMGNITNPKKHCFIREMVMNPTCDSEQDSIETNTNRATVRHLIRGHRLTNTKRAGKSRPGDVTNGALEPTKTTGEWLA